MPEPIQNALLALAFLACGGLHVVLRLLSLHLCNEYPSLQKKKKKKKGAVEALCNSILFWGVGGCSLMNNSLALVVAVQLCVEVLTTSGCAHFLKLLASLSL